MAAGNVIFAVLTALVAVNCIFAAKNPLGHGDGKPNHGPPSKENNEEKKYEGTISLLFDSSTSPVLSSSCNATQGPNYYLSCTKEILCHATSRGIGLRCHGTLRSSNGSSSPGSQCKSG